MTQIHYLSVWRSEVQNQSHWANIKLSAGLVPSRGIVGENLFPCLLQFLHSTCFPWLVASASIFKISSVASSKRSLYGSFVRHLSLASLFKDTCDYIGPTWVIIFPSQDPWFSHICKILFAMSSNIVQVLGIRVWTFLEGYYSASLLVIILAIFEMCRSSHYSPQSSHEVMRMLCKLWSALYGS